MAVKKASGSKKVAPTVDEIQRRAHEIYLDRVSKNLPGDERSDWMEAEKQLRDQK